MTARNRSDLQIELFIIMVIWFKCNQIYDYCFSLPTTNSVMNNSGTIFVVKTLHMPVAQIY
jgi:hypothetical protein